MDSTFVIEERSGEDHVVALATNQVMKAGLTAGPVQRLQGPLVVPGTHKVDYTIGLADDRCAARRTDPGTYQS